MHGIDVPRKEDRRKRLQQLRTVIAVLTDQARKLREEGDYTSAYERLDSIEIAEREYVNILNELEKTA